MPKIHRTSNFQSFLPLFLNKALEVLHEKFLESDLGKIYQAIPWQEMAKTLKLKDKGKGPISIFPPEGKIALMFLKSYSQTSDKRLVEQINGNIHYQLFCGIRLEADQQLSNYKIVSQIRSELSKSFNWKAVQKTLADHWLPYMKQTYKVLVDATCYESAVRYPTDQKLLWESVTFLYRAIKNVCKKRRLKIIRSKYNDWEARYNGYARKKRKSKKERKSLTRGLLKLLEKLDQALDVLEEGFEFENNDTYRKQRETIKKVLEQQQQLFYTGTYPKNRILSLYKPYLRPIARGKEIKKFEFGAKVNKVQIDGISFIQCLSFDPFHEGKEFEGSIEEAQKLTGIKVRQIGGDAVYATNANRTLATSQGISTDFARKGRAGKNEEERKKTARSLRKERGSTLEGSFGNEKEHFSLKRINARTEANEKLWIFFGIHTANALQIGHRMSAARSAAY